MILISLLIALAIERVIDKNPRWQIETWAKQYWQCVQSKLARPRHTSDTTIWALILLPAIVLALAEYYLLGHFLTFIEQTAMVLLCIGCPALRQTYKCFLRAAKRGDEQACALYTEQLGHTGIPESAGQVPKTFGQHLIWLNYQYYAAVILWFIAFGAPGALFYCTVRTIATMSLPRRQRLSAAHMLYALDFIPVRITALGMLLVGDFSQALPVWLRYCPDMRVPASIILADVAFAAETRQPQTEDLMDEPSVLVKLAKRNITFLIIMTAILTIVGAVA